ncbi:hypothetical protein PAPYR_4255 [Paratrimastix pyriformis]|uniref:Uncharacterized protein n=1 Tax=Paratrimastix pyriformis TaxID=342808 RepID=A0ABQ8US24_9EUKA|nr:hypothetical protein PAPYR_4255 [Paratrimastix pyriformis]
MRLLEAGFDRFDIIDEWDECLALAEEHLAQLTFIPPSPAVFDSPHLQRLMLQAPHISGDVVEGLSMNPGGSSMSKPLVPAREILGALVDALSHGSDPLAAEAVKQAVAHLLLKPLPWDLRLVSVHCISTGNNARIGGSPSNSVPLGGVVAIVGAVVPIHPGQGPALRDLLGHAPACVRVVLVEGDLVRVGNSAGMGLLSVRQSRLDGADMQTIVDASMERWAASIMELLADLSTSLATCTGEGQHCESGGVAGGGALVVTTGRVDPFLARRAASPRMPDGPSLCILEGCGPRIVAQLGAALHLRIHSAARLCSTLVSAVPAPAPGSVGIPVIPASATIGRDLGAPHSVGWASATSAAAALASAELLDGGWMPADMRSFMNPATDLPQFETLLQRTLSSLTDGMLPGAGAWQMSLAKDLRAAPKVPQQRDVDRAGGDAEDVGDGAGGESHGCLQPIRQCIRAHFANVLENCLALVLENCGLSASEIAARLTETCADGLAEPAPTTLPAPPQRPLSLVWWPVRGSLPPPGQATPALALVARELACPLQDCSPPSVHDVIRAVVVDEARATREALRRAVGFVTTLLRLDRAVAPKAFAPSSAPA